MRGLVAAACPAPRRPAAQHLRPGRLPDPPAGAAKCPASTPAALARHCPTPAQHHLGHLRVPARVSAHASSGRDSDSSSPSSQCRRRMGRDLEHPKQDHDRAEARCGRTGTLVLCTRPSAAQSAQRSSVVDRILRAPAWSTGDPSHAARLRDDARGERGARAVTQQLAGHADSRVTREVYTHVTGSMLDGRHRGLERAAEELYGQAPTAWSRAGSQSTEKGEGDGQEVEGSGG